MIRVENLNKSFGSLQVLKDISAEYEPGKCNMIIGKSGSGKTVLLKNIMGLMIPDSGEVWYGDRKLSSLSYEEKMALRQKIGVLFQGSAIFDFATVIENVMFPMQFFTDWSRDRMIERARFCLDRVEVMDSDDKYPSELSGGMQKRVGIARAIALNPSYLFCDEPNSGLDPHTSILIDQLISELTREYNMTTIVNTHDMNSILEIGDRISFIDEGKLLWQGTKDNLLDTDCEELKEFLCSNTLVRNIIRK
ncbi:MAG: ATP-binding cassette domain-containing protein [Bacteroidetes bacterium]|uniref:ATP-binding cassette domain-containing protein n=1 Tax=Candidatus Cryptobacteroides faecigallinarum TaxID=2840763 RepID=A0A9D9IJ49_9BACT|nr:ATP-binding cassette domain-containing protein [Candidatus Cryptobacteroides faecigallinarum]